MKLKDVLLAVCIVALLGSDFFLFRANDQRNTALVQSGAARQDADQARAELEQLKTNNAAAQGGEISRLRADNLELPRLRSQIAQLQATNAALQATNLVLIRELSAVLAIAQKQQGQVEQLQTQYERVSAAAQASEAEVERNQCINNLREIDAAKQQWALVNNKGDDAIPTAQDLLLYLPDQTFPVCPSGGNYTIGAVGVAPTCSIPGHVLPQ